MKTFNSIQSIQQKIQAFKAQGLKIGLVPTMGALHDGHLSLVHKCNDDCDITVCSIFVNPTQFNDPNDLKNYPQTLEKDLELLQENGCDLSFVPSVDTMYKNKPTISISFGELEANLEGANRPGHFNGVGIVVSKLFNIIQPHHAYFGQKDLQQVAIIKDLVQQLSFPINIITCPISREENGLARSSRNEQLNIHDRNKAKLIYECLQKCRIESQNKSIQEIEENAIESLGLGGFEVEYVTFIDLKTFTPAKSIEKNETSICIAARIGGVRLIDNIIL